MKSLGYDVLCVGGGLAGVALAVTCARKGKNVLLVEKNEFLGGGAVASSCVEIPEKKSAFASEFISRLKERNGICGLAVNTELVKFVLLEMCKETGVDILFHTVVSSVERTENGVGSVFITGKGTTCAVKAGYYVDSTGTGEFAELAGASLRQLKPYTADYTFSICDYRKGSVFPDDVVSMPSAENGRILVKFPAVEFENLDSVSISGVLYGFADKTLSFINNARKNYKGFESAKVSSVPPMLNVYNGRTYDVSGIDCFEVCGKSLGPDCRNAGDVFLSADELAEKLLRNL